jgi:hypothetical protein
MVGNHAAGQKHCHECGFHAALSGQPHCGADFNGLNCTNHHIFKGIGENAE